jgi:multiple sugar transport system ATP-binding protein
MNFLDAQVVGSSSDGLRVKVLGSSEVVVPVRGDARPGSSVSLGIRPEHVQLAPSDTATLSGEVLVVERLGGETFLHIDVGTETPFVVKADGSVLERPGARVGLSFPPAALHLFDAGGAAFGHLDRNVLLH